MLDSELAIVGREEEKGNAGDGRVYNNISLSSSLPFAGPPTRPTPLAVIKGNKGKITAGKRTFIMLLRSQESIRLEVLPFHAPRPFHWPRGPESRMVEETQERI